MACHVSEGLYSIGISLGQARCTPTRRAPVWEHFQQELVEVNGVMKVVCKYCGLIMCFHAQFPFLM
jgi:hypothetical protein